MTFTQKINASFIERCTSFDENNTTFNERSTIYTATAMLNSCVSSGASVAVNNSGGTSSPVITVVNNCNGTSKLTASSYTGTLLWSPGGSKTTSITVSTAGTYSVTQTISGCTSAAGTGIAVPRTTPSAPVVLVINNCGYSTLSTIATGSLLWNVGSATTSTITITTSGTVKVTQTVNGCTSPAGRGTSAPRARPSAPIVKVSNVCGTSVLSTNATGLLIWSTLQAGSSITVTAAGTYSVSATVNGCTSAESTGTAAPKEIPPTPVITVVNNCGSSVLSTTTKGSLLWTSRYTTSSVTATTAGTYLVIATVNGCTSLPGEGIAAPKAIPDKPVVIVVNNCGSSKLYSDAQGILKWSTGETGTFITVTATATYSLTQTVNGCISADGTGKSAPVKSAPSTGAITGNSTGPCNNTSPVTYSIAPVPGTTSYIWVLPAGCTAPSTITTVPNIEVTFTPLASTGSIFVQATNVCGAGNASDKKITTDCPGHWTTLTNTHSNLGTGTEYGGMLLLSDGTVLAKSSDGGTDTYGNTYYKLTPVNGSYVKGTWSAIEPMHDTRLHYSSQVLKDGRVYVAGGEHGSGTDSAEVYDPLTGHWTRITNTLPTAQFSDANSNLLDNGDVLQSAAVYNNIKGYFQGDYTFDPTTNKLSSCCSINSSGNQDEATWVKLPDGSILMVDDPNNPSLTTDSSERYIPSLGKWVTDATVPVQLYTTHNELGPAFLLPDGRAFFIGGNGHTAYYTPSGNNSNGS